jgi:hypothetical protein
MIPLAAGANWAGTLSEFRELPINAVAVAPNETLNWISRYNIRLLVEGRLTAAVQWCAKVTNGPRRNRQEAEKGTPVIQTQMCQVFFDMFVRIQKGSGLLPTVAQVLEEASIHSGIMPYLSLRHPQEDGDCAIALFAPAWQQWLELPSSPRLQSEVMDVERSARKSGILLQAGLHGCGFHEIGKFSSKARKNFYVESLSLPALSEGQATNIFGFAVPFPGDVRDAPARHPAPARRWLNLGRGVPAMAPGSTMCSAT